MKTLLNARQVIDGVGCVQRVQQLLVQVVGVEGATHVSEDALEVLGGGRSVEGTLPPQIAVGIEDGQPV